MATYAEYLKAQGATDEEIKVLDTAVGRRAFDKMNTEAEESRQAAAKLEETMKNYEARVNQWYQENDTKLKQVQNKAIQAEAESARAKAALLEAERQGLLENVAKNMGYEPEVKKEPTAVDDRYVPREEFMKIADGIGQNLAALEDMVIEHKQLFPDRPLSVRQLRSEALAAGKNVYDYWENKFKVNEAREQAATKQREAEIAKWKLEGAKEKEQELVSKFGNPETRPLMPSKSPFAPRPNDNLRADNQPWNKSETQLSNDRVARATKNLIDKQLSN